MNYYDESEVHHKDNPLMIFEKSNGLETLVETISRQSTDLFALDDASSLLLKIREQFTEGRSTHYKFSKTISGKERTFVVPLPILRQLTERFIVPLIKSAPVHQSSHGGERGWSNKKSINSHYPCKALLSFDLSEAFNQITYDHVFELFYKSLINCEETYRVPIANFLSWVTTVEKEGNRVLPQGAPHSASLFNRILFSLDSKIANEAHSRQMHYTRWIDDFLISGSENVNLERFIGAVSLVQNQFRIHPQKIFYQTDFKNIYALGLVITSEGIRKNSLEEAALKNESKVNLEHYSHITW